MRRNCANSAKKPPFNNGSCSNETSIIYTRSILPPNPSRNLAKHLAEIRIAIERTLSSLWDEHQIVLELSRQIVAARTEAHRNYEQARRIALMDDDDDGLATLIHWDTYFGSDKKQHDLSLELGTIEERLARHSEKRAVEAGTLLQNAKQCISFVHGASRTAAPNGRRSIAREPLRNVVWEGRNQSLHWEEGAFKPNLHAVFAALRSEYQGRFDDYQTRNKAFEVVDVLGWKTWDAFYDDIMSFS